jgi:two-component system OmpR family sensor kinase
MTGGDDIAAAGPPDGGTLPPQPAALPEPPEPPGRPRGGHRLRFLRELSHRTPLRTKLIVSVLALVIMALAAISVASDVVLNSYLTTRQDTQLEENFGLALQQADSGRPFHVGEAYSAPTGQQGMYVEFVEPGQQFAGPLGNGSVFPGNGSSPRSQSLPQLPSGRSWPGSAGPVLQTLPSQSGGDAWRVIAQTASFQTTVNGSQPQAQDLTIVVAANLGPVNATIRRLVAVEVIVGAAIVIVLAAVSVGVVRANLRPLDDIEMTAGQIARGHLEHRIPERDPRTEIGSLGQSLNAMLSQIERAFHAQEASEQAAHESEERMRRFIADASHELRTPLTTIRGFAEYYRQRGGSPPTGPAQSAAGHLSADDLDRLMQRIEAEASRMGLLVEDLLELARLDQQRPLDLRPVDLLTVTLDTVQDARIISPDRTIDLSVAPGAAFIVNGDEARLRQVVGNLVTNARTHTPPGTPIRVRLASGTLESGEPAVVLDVEDDGPGMTPEQARRVFERFYRADAARNRTSGGTGLGLAIVAGLVAAHGGTVSVRTAPGQGADFQVRLPLSPDARSTGEEDDEDECYSGDGFADGEGDGQRQ